MSKLIKFSLVFTVSVKGKKYSRLWTIRQKQSNTKRVQTLLGSKREGQTLTHKGHMYYNPSGFYKCTFSSWLQETLLKGFVQQMEGLQCDLMSSQRILQSPFSHCFCPLFPVLVLQFCVINSMQIQLLYSFLIGKSKCYYVYDILHYEL